jgi:hypothetical protein
MFSMTLPNTSIQYYYWMLDGEVCFVKPNQEITIEKEWSNEKRPQEECPVCLRNRFRKVAIMDCKHSFCISCISKHHKNNCLQQRHHQHQVPTACPICRQPLKKMVIHKTEK